LWRLHTDILRVLVLERLESHAHAQPLAVKHGAAAVAAVDGGVDLHSQQLGRGVRVGRHLHARGDARSDADGVAADWEAHDGALVLQPRQAAHHDGRHVRPERVVVDGEQRLNVQRKESHNKKRLVEERRQRTRSHSVPMARMRATYLVSRPRCFSFTWVA